MYYIGNRVAFETQTVVKVVTAAHHSGACDSPVQLVLTDVHSDELHLIQVVGEQGDRIGAVQVCGRHLGRDAALCALVCPVQFPYRETHGYEYSPSASPSPHMRTSTTDSIHV